MRIWTPVNGSRAPHPPEPVALPWEPVAQHREEPRIAHDHGEGADGGAEPPLSHEGPILPVSLLRLPVESTGTRGRWRVGHGIPGGRHGGSHRLEVGSDGGTYSTSASSLPRLTCALRTPGIARSAASIAVTQDAQVMPLIWNRSLALPVR